MNKLIRYFIYRLFDPSENLTLIWVFAIPAVITVLIMYVFSPNLRIPMLVAVAVFLVALLIKISKDLVMDLTYCWRSKRHVKERKKIGVIKYTL